MFKFAALVTNTAPAIAINGTATQAHSTRRSTRNKAQFTGTSTTRYAPSIQATKPALGISIPAAAPSDSLAAVETAFLSLHPQTPAP